MLAKKLVLALGGAAVALAPIAAQAATSASALSPVAYNQARGSADLVDGSQLDGGAPEWLIPALLALGVAVYVLIDELGDDDPASP